MSLTGRTDAVKEEEEMATAETTEADTLSGLSENDGKDSPEIMEDVINEQRDQEMETLFKKGVVEPCEDNTDESQRKRHDYEQNKEKHMQELKVIQDQDQEETKQQQQQQSQNDQIQPQPQSLSSPGEVCSTWCVSTAEFSNKEKTVGSESVVLSTAIISDQPSTIVHQVMDPPKRTDSVDKQNENENAKSAAVTTNARQLTENSLTLDEDDETQLFLEFEKLLQEKHTKRALVEAVNKIKHAEEYGNTFAERLSHEKETREIAFMLENESSMDDSTEDDKLFMEFQCLLTRSYERDLIGRKKAERPRSLIEDGSEDILIVDVPDRATEATTINQKSIDRRKKVKILWEGEIDPHEITDDLISSSVVSPMQSGASSPPVAIVSPTVQKDSVRKSINEPSNQVGGSTGTSNVAVVEPIISLENNEKLSSSSVPTTALEFSSLQTHVPINDDQITSRTSNPTNYSRTDSQKTTPSTVVQLTTFSQSRVKIHTSTTTSPSRNENPQCLPLFASNNRVEVTENVSSLRRIPGANTRRTIQNRERTRVVEQEQFMQNIKKTQNIHQQQIVHFENLSDEQIENGRGRNVGFIVNLNAEESISDSASFTPSNSQNLPPTLLNNEPISQMAIQAAPMHVSVQNQNLSRYGPQAIILSSRPQPDDAAALNKSFDASLGHIALRQSTYCVDQSRLYNRLSIDQDVDKMKFQAAECSGEINSMPITRNLINARNISGNDMEPFFHMNAGVPIESQPQIPSDFYSQRPVVGSAPVSTDYLPNFNNLYGQNFKVTRNMVRPQQPIENETQVPATDTVLSKRSSHSQAEVQEPVKRGIGYVVDLDTLPEPLKAPPRIPVPKKTPKKRINALTGAAPTSSSLMEEALQWGETSKVDHQIEKVTSDPQQGFARGFCSTPSRNSSQGLQQTLFSWDDGSEGIKPEKEHSVSQSPKRDPLRTASLTLQESLKWGEDSVEENVQLREKPKGQQLRSSSVEVYNKIANETLLGKNTIHKSRLPIHNKRVSHPETVNEFHQMHQQQMQYNNMSQQHSYQQHIFPPPFDHATLIPRPHFPFPYPNPELQNLSSTRPVMPFNSPLNAPPHDEVRFRRTPVDLPATPPISERPKSASFVVDWNEIEAEISSSTERIQPRVMDPRPQAPAPVSFEVGVEDLKPGKRQTTPRQQQQQQNRRIPRLQSDSAPRFRPAEKFVIDFNDERPVAASGIKITPFQNKWASSLSYNVEFPKERHELETGQQQSSLQGSPAVPSASGFERKKIRTFQSKLLTPKKYKSEPKKRDNLENPEK